MMERWLPVPCATCSPFYQVSDLGRIWSEHVSRVLEPWPDGNDYLQVTMATDSTGKRHAHKVHKLVLGAFIGPCPPGMERLHGPGGHRDNSLPNLSYGTRSQNQGPDRVRDGTSNRGERCGNAKLTWTTADEIRTRYARGEAVPVLAAMYGVSQPTLSNLLRGWTWVTAETPPPPPRQNRVKLSQAIATEIRLRYRAGGITQAALAQEFGTDQGSVSFIVRNKMWRDAL